MSPNLPNHRYPSVAIRLFLRNHFNANHILYLLWVGTPATQSLSKQGSHLAQFHCSLGSHNSWLHGTSVDITFSTSSWVGKTNDSSIASTQGSNSWPITLHFWQSQHG